MAIFNCVYLQIICINIQEMPINILLELIFVLEKAQPPNSSVKEEGRPFFLFLEGLRHGNRIFSCRNATLCHVLEEIYYSTFSKELVHPSVIITFIVLEILCYNNLDYPIILTNLIKYKGLLSLFKASSYMTVSPFLANVPILYSLKTPENLWYKIYKMGTFKWKYTTM